MKQQYKPMLAKANSTPFSDVNWIFEVKWDGFRALAYINEKLKLLSRNQKELTQKFPELQELTKLTKNSVLDGEIVIIKNGKPDFHSLLKRNQMNNPIEINLQCKNNPASFMVFDILEKNEKPLIDLPLIERKKILKKTVKEGNHVFISDYIEKKGEEYYKIIIEKGLEGIIAKKKVSKYENGIRSNNWLKIKKLKSVDSVVFGYTKGSGIREQTFGALLLGLYDNSKPIYIGRVGTGFSQQTLLELTKQFKNFIIKKSTFQLKEIKEITWLKPKIVCEIFYQSVTKEGKLRLPKFHSIKTDKSPKECTIEQISQEQLYPYLAKRDFTKTDEPRGDKKIEEKAPIFVIQEHHSRRLHYDLRLEKEGVLKSWAVPKGIPMEINKKRLAVQVEDHPLEYSRFEGIIPKGQYGAGTVKIWDKGTFTIKSWEKDIIEVFPKGQKFQGKYILVRIKKGEGKNWLLFKGRNSTE